MPNSDTTTGSLSDEQTIILSRNEEEIDAQIKAERNSWES